MGAVHLPDSHLADNHLPDKYSPTLFRSYPFSVINCRENDCRASDCRANEPDPSRSEQDIFLIAQLKAMNGREITASRRLKINRVLIGEFFII